MVWWMVTMMLVTLLVQMSDLDSAGRSASMMMEHQTAQPMVTRMLVTQMVRMM
jgi:hypothetical protein